MTIHDIRNLFCEYGACLNASIIRKKTFRTVCELSVDQLPFIRLRPSLQTVLLFTNYTLW